MQIPANFVPRPYQLQLLQQLDGVADKPETRKYRALLVWPRQHGKDTTCFAYLAKEAARVPGNYFYIFPTKEEARKAIWEKVMDDGTKLIDMIPKEFRQRLSNQEMSMTLNNGSTIRLVGLDKDPDSIRGITPQGVVFSEFAFSDFEAYKTLLPAMHRSDSWLIINSTPNGRNHFYDMYLGAEKDAGWHVDFKQCLYPGKKGYINSFDQSHFQGMVDRGEMLWEDIEREYGCDFSTGTKGSYYLPYIEKAFKEGRIGNYMYDDNNMVDTFWDIGTDDYTAIWFVQREGNAIILIDYYEDFGKGWTEYATVLREKGYKYRTHYLPHDGKKTQMELVGVERAHRLFETALSNNKVGGYVGSVPKPGSKLDPIMLARKLFNRCCFHRATCLQGLSRLELFHKKWDKKTKTFSREPAKDDNVHGADAFGYMAMIYSRDTPYSGNNNVEEFRLKVEMDYDLFGD